MTNHTTTSSDLTVVDLQIKYGFAVFWIVVWLIQFCWSKRHFEEWYNKATKRHIHVFGFWVHTIGIPIFAAAGGVATHMLWLNESHFDFHKWLSAMTCLLLAALMDKIWRWSVFCLGETIRTGIAIGTTAAVLGFALSATSFGLILEPTIETGGKPTLVASVVLTGFVAIVMAFHTISLSTLLVFPPSKFTYMSVQTT